MRRWSDGGVSLSVNMKAEYSIWFGASFKVHPRPRRQNLVRPRPRAALPALAILLTLLAFGGGQPLLAQAADSVAELKQQLRQLQENFERMQREQRAQIEALTRKLDHLAKQAAAAGNAQHPEHAPVAAPQESPPGVPASPEASTPPAAWSPAHPLTLARTDSAHLDISFDVLANFGGSTASRPADCLQLGHHDPNQRGFSLSAADIAFDGVVDPYFEGFVNICLSLDGENETHVDLEEAYLQTISLPAGLQAKAGQFYAGFGRQNPQHAHEWAFVDSPVILTRAFGPEGLRNVGAQVSWSAPTPFFTEAMLGVFNPQGETAFSFRNPEDPHGRASFKQNLRGPGDLLYVPRLASSFDLTEQQTLAAGLSAAFGPNATGAGLRTQIYGLDLYWKWKAAGAPAGFPFVSWQTEALYQRYAAGADPAPALPAETLHDWGFYSQVLWGFKPRWVAGLRGEYATGNRGAGDSQDVFRGERTRLSPGLTFYSSEFSKIRLQYNYDRGNLFGTEHSVWLQVEFLLGAHGAHKF
ncbi:MAG TPA: hypothetical protein PK751_01405 [Verrucomicrobiota bacterium]|nr:hypothetical protein [Verrucomicrobiota bacterium]HOC49656.1 hypothetical protein [Verrucomicrobiota bacterium]HPW91048.1 hypothetical protein [Verrucomicrobiota bacterium]HQB71781.1 hypothetical protein [Verrucomicrobiota bacterium]